MDKKVSQLTKLFQKLEIKSTDPTDMNILEKLFAQMKISYEPDELDSVINSIKSLKIDDDIGSVTIKLKNDIVVHYQVFGCDIEHRNDFIPHWGEAF